MYLEVVMNDNFKVNIEQKLKQKFKLSQNMKVSLEILKMPLNELNKYVKNEVLKDFPVDVNLKNKDFNKSGNEYISELDNLSDEKNFFEILEEELSYLKISLKVREICIFIINNLNQRGYLEISKIEIKNMLKVNDKELEKAFEIIYNLEPYGVGAYSLEECLKIQLNAKNILDNKLFIFIDNYLYLLADKKYKEIMKKLEITEEQLYDYIKIIKSLNPIPSRGYNVGKIEKIIPDIFVEVKNNEIFYEINKELIPQINLDNSRDRELKKINEIISCIEKRFQTLDRIMKIIVREQEKFFLNNGKNQNSLKIIDIASELDLSPSTVSRAIKEKYIKTDFGIISLRKLFTLDATSLIVQEKITELIENENRKEPYTDKKLVNLLEKDNIYVARRTVTKYREELGYKSSNKRKVREP